MAKMFARKDSKKNSVDTQVPAVGESVQTPVTTNVETATQKEEAKKMDITLTRKSTQKNGVSTYSTEGIKASVYFNKTFFTGGNAPDTIVISAPDGVIVAPGSVVSGKGAAAVSPERAAKAAEVAKKSAERLAKLQERAKKQQEVADRMKAALGTTEAAAQ